MSRIEQALDIISKLNATNQVYIIGHDIPVSISWHAYALLDKKRKEIAEELGVPENQYEFEDLILILTGATTVEEWKEILEGDPEG
jgi:hypothetical protein